MSRSSRSPVEQIEFMRNVLAFSLVASFIGAMTAFTFFVIPEQNRDILTYMVGQLSGMALTALGFYFVNKVGQDALDAEKTKNTGKLADLAKTALAKDGEGAVQGAREVEGAATDKREEIEKEQGK